MDELKASGKPFQISKQEVWDAWLKVKGNKGAPGADEVSLADTRYWPGGARRRGGVSLVCGSCAEREKARPDTAASAAVGGSARAGSAP